MTNRVSVKQVQGAVRRLCRDPHAEVVDWQQEQVWTPLHDRTVGVHRVWGTLQKGASAQSWELILKLVPRLLQGNEHPEVMAYQTGFLAHLRGRLRAPRCYGITDIDGDTTALWLESLTDLSGKAWPLERFQLVAHQLGELNGANLGQPRPGWMIETTPWSDLEVVGARNLEWLREVQNHPRVRAVFPNAVVERLLDLWDSRDELSDALARIPRTVCHGDAQRRNLFAVQDLDGQHQTVAIDWANIAWAWLGRDSNTLMHQALIYSDTDQVDPAAFDQAVFTAYVRGLHAMSWAGDERIARLGHTASLAAHPTFGEIRPILLLATDDSRHEWAERFYGKTVPEILDRRALVVRFLLDAADEAHRLARLGPG